MIPTVPARDSLNQIIQFSNFRHYMFLFTLNTSCGLVHAPSFIVILLLFLLLFMFVCCAYISLSAMSLSTYVDKSTWLKRGVGTQRSAFMIIYTSLTQSETTPQMWFQTRSYFAHCSPIKFTHQPLREKNILKDNFLFQNHPT